MKAFFSTYTLLISIILLNISCQQGMPIELNATNANLTLKNGILYYNETPFSGNLVMYQNDGKLTSDIQYTKGKKHGYEKHWYEDQTLAVERYYTENIKTGIHKAWWNDKTLKFVYHFNSQGAYHGNVKEWYKTGQLFRDFNYENGKEVGSQQLWKSNGNIKANYEVVGGERFGLIGLKKCYTVTVNSDEVK